MEHIDLLIALLGDALSSSKSLAFQALALGLETADYSIPVHHLRGCAHQIMNTDDLEFKRENIIVQEHTSNMDH